MTDKHRREHGLIFGRGDALGDDVEEPPMAEPPFGLRIPGYNPEPIAFGVPPAEDVTLTGELPWELREEPPSGTVPAPSR
jgi:hypothetical protein